MPERLFKSVFTSIQSTFSSNEKYTQVKFNYCYQYVFLRMIIITITIIIASEKAVEVWGEDVKVLDKIIDSEANVEEDEESTAEYVIIGTIYKEMALRSSVLDEFRDATDIKVANVGDNFSSSVRRRSS